MSLFLSTSQKMFSMLTNFHVDTRTKLKRKPVFSKEWTGKIIYFNFSSIFGDLFLKFKSRVIKKSQELNRKLK